ncbi:hypothetical protein [uncultured Tateyamaria sp.]|uniref:hypothetical protein n=1 Tax=uncultured Tateyamaria sp. TaxID=455651 RepID=UPI002621431D|nr:hypothetical protein [uncultured Tateyamaria sp.]
MMKLVLWLLSLAAATATPVLLDAAGVPSARVRYDAAMALVDSDPAQAFEQMHALAADNDARAMDRLGHFHVAGIGTQPDTNAAIAQFRAAVDHGRARSRLPLGANLLRTGQIEAARTALEQAADDDIPGAVATLAWAHATRALGAASDPEDGWATLYARAVAADRIAELRLVALVAKTGRTHGNLDAVLASLHTRAMDGDLRATETLLRYLRLRGHPRNDLALRSELLALPGLRPKAAVEEGLHLAARTQAHRFWTASEDIVNDAPADVYARALLTTYKINKNAYVRLLQKELRKRGYATGRANGYLTASTIRAFSRFCRDAGIARDCRRGPLNWATLQAATRALAQSRVPSEGA